MNSCRSKMHSPSGKRPGRSDFKRGAFTLLEVVVGLSLMATVLVSSLLAFSAHHRQLRFAEAKLEAVAISDTLLNQLSDSSGGIPASGRGGIGGKPNWFWQTAVIGSTTPAGMPLQVIRLQVIEIATDGSAKPLASVDVVKGIQ